MKMFFVKPRNTDTRVNGTCPCDPKKRSYSGDIFRELLKGNYVQTLTVVYRTDIINDPLYVGGLDYALSLQCALLGKCCYMNEQMGCYRLHQDSAIHTMNIRLTQISIEIWERYVERYLSKKDHRRPFWEHCRICGTIDACLISKKRSGNEQTEQAKRILSKHPELKKYMWLGVLNRVRHSIQKRLA